MALRHWLALTSAACQWRKTIRVTRPCKSITAAILIVSFLAALTGCGDTSGGSRRGGGGGRAAPTNQQRAEILVGTMATLFSLEEYELGQAQQLVMTRINQWMRGQEPKTPWQREPRLDTLPANLRDLRAIDALGENDFLYDDDFAMLREAVWMDRISSHVRSEMDREATKPNQGRAATTVRYVSPDDPEQLRLAMHLFDWTIKNVQLEVDEWPDEKTGYTYKLREHWHTPYETILLGRGTASDRAWAFILLGRQQGLDIVMLGLGDPQKPAELQPWIPALVLARAKGHNKSVGDSDTPPPSGDETENTADLLLFDPALGTPIPGPDGQGIATLDQVAAEDQLLRALDLDENRKYPVKADDLKQVTALVEASPGYLSRRMKFLESNLSGDQRVILSVSPSAVESKIKSAKHVHPRLVLWSRPYETHRLRLSEDERLQGMASAELYPLQGLAKSVSETGTDRKTVARREESQEWSDQEKRGAPGRRRVPLGVGRMMQLAGNLGSEGGALRYLQQATTTESEQELTQLMVGDLRNQLADANDPAMQQQLNQRATATVREILRADQAAKLWIGQIKAELGELETAVKYFTTWEPPDWKPTRDYSLARVYEQQGKTADAIRVYQESESPQRHGNLLRSRRLGKLAQEKTVQN